MIQANITTFTSWFLSQFVRIGTYVIQWLDEIKIYNEVSLLDFVITLVIIEGFIGIILTLPQTANRQSTKYERKNRKDNKNDKQ